MDMSFEDQIRERAYHIWMAGGMADGQAHEHWVSAEQAVRGEVAAAPAVAKPASAKTAAKTTAKASKSAAAPKTNRAAKAKKADLHVAH